ncbi:MAG TPA: twin-arginine translocase TatA/TatE family subunit [Polyangia bacterium]|jgi:TatA/E family protein of Tat protein translocase|nr:twin-arginine translocase TatA/TatE family subunit [Polyangia bacterium]
MFNLGMGEITVILVLLLLFVGPSKLPELAQGLGKFIRQIRKATADVKNEIVLDDSFRKPFEELRDAVTLSPEELKRRDQIKQSIEDARKQVEAFERANAIPDDGAATPPPETPPASGAPPAVAAGDTSWPPPLPASPVPPPPPPPGLVPPVAPPVGTFSRSPTPFPLQPGRLGGSQRVTPPISSVTSDRANITQVLTEEDLKPMSKGAPPPLPPPLPGVPSLPGVAPPPPPPGTKKG